MRTVPKKAEGCFDFSEEDLQHFRTVDPHILARAEVEEKTLWDAISDSSNRHGYWITAEN